MAETAPSHGKSPSARQASAPATHDGSPLVWLTSQLALVVALIWGVMPGVAHGNPTGGVAVHGQASFTSSGNHLLVQTQNGSGSQHSVINWQSFSIPSGSSTYFQQPSAASTSINRVVTATPSLLFGTLGSNGNLVLVNQSGITIGAGAMVDTAGFTATTLGMTEADAVAGRMRFGNASFGGSSGALTVQGNIISRSGDVLLIAPSVDLAASAVVESAGGAVSLVAGQQVEITGRGLEGITLQVQAPADSAVNLGTLRGDAVGIFAGTLRHSGVAQAHAVTSEGGKIVLKAQGLARVDGAGQLEAQALNGRGGAVQVLGSQVQLADQARIDASGASGGGTVLIGGDYQGQNSALPNATTTTLEAGVVVQADALQAGDGGRVIVWADDTAQVHAQISARGGAQGGDGGFVETSGKRLLEVSRAVDASAPQGQAGTWLLDPNNITIQASGSDTNVDAALNSTNDSSIVTTGTIQTALNAGTNVTISTSTGGTNAQAGDITLATGAAINKTAGTDAVLTLNAHNNINLNASIASTAGKLDLVLNADSDASGAGSVNLGTTTLSTNGGSINASAESVVIASGTATVNSSMVIKDLTMTGGTLGGTGNVQVTGSFNVSGTQAYLSGTGTFTTQGASSISMSQGNGFLSLTGGRTWVNEGTLTIGGDDYLYLGYSSSGTNTLSNTSSGTINLSSSNASPINIWGGNGVVNNAGVIEQLASGTHEMRSTTLNNTGQIKASVGRLEITASGEDSGQYTVASGATLDFAGGTRNLNAGSDITGAGALDVSAGTVTLNAQAGLANTGSGLEVSGGTLNVGTGVSGNLAPATVSSGTLNFNNSSTVVLPSLTMSGGTLGGTGNVQVTGGFTVSGTQAYLSGTGTFTTQGTSTISMSQGNGFLSLTGGRTWVNEGTLTIGGDDYLYLGYSSSGTNTLSNTSGGTINLSSSNASPINIWGGNGVVNNAGVIEQLASGTHEMRSTTLNNTGQIKASVGRLEITASGEDSGQYIVASGATLDFAGGTRNLNAGSDITGAGALDVSAGVVTLNAQAGLANTGSGLEVSGGTLNVGTGVSGNLAAATVSSGTLNFNNSSTVVLPSLAMSGGTLGGTGNVQVTGGFTVSGTTAYLSGTGTFTTQGASSISMSQSNAFLSLTGGRTWVNEGTLTIGGDDYLYLGYSSSGTNTLSNTSGGTIKLSSSNASPINIWSGTGVVNNAGVIEQLASGTHEMRSTTLNNTGQIKASVGRLEISASGEDTGQYAVAGGATLDFTGGTRNLNAGSDITGAGALDVSAGVVTLNAQAGLANTGSGLEVSGGTLNVGTGVSGNLAPATVSSGTLNFNNSSTVVLPSLTMSGGTLGGTGNVRVSGSFNVSGTTAYLTGTGTVTTQGASTISMSQANGFLSLTGGRTWVNEGTLTIGGDDYLFLGYSSSGNNTLSNTAAGKINLSSSNATPISLWGGTGVVNNAGVIEQLASGTHEVRSTTLNNTGQVKASVGRLEISASGEDSGQYVVAGGATLDFIAGTRNLNAGSDITGAGALDVSGGTVTLNAQAGLTNTGSGLEVSGGTLNVGTGVSGNLAPATVSSGTLNFNNSSTVVLPSLTMSGGTLGGTGNVQVSSSFTVSGTTAYLSGTGTFTTQGVSTINMSQANSFLSLTGGRSWVNEGTLTIGGDDYLYLGYSSSGNNTLSNTAAGKINLSSSNATPINIWGGTGVVNNAGVLEQLASGTHEVRVSTLNNTGQVKASLGRLEISASGDDTGQYIVASGATLDFVAGTRNLNAGSDITGAGALDVSGGTVTINAQAGLTNSGSSLEVSGGTLNVGTGVSGNLAAATVSSGTLNFNNSSTVVLPSLAMSGGTLGGTGNVQVTGSFNVSGTTAFLSGTGSFTTQGASTINMSQTNGFLSLTGGRTWVNEGTLTIGGDDYLYLGYSSSGSNTLSNTAAGKINLSSSNVSPISIWGGTGVVNNAGVIEQLASGTHEMRSSTLNNTGQIKASVGRLEISASGEDSGQYTVASGATLDFTGGTRNLNAGSDITGTGALDVSAGTVNINAQAGLANTGSVIEVSGGTLNVGTGVSGSLAPTVVSTGTLNFAADASIGNLTWTGGNIGGNGALLTPSGGIAKLEGYNNRYLVNKTWNNAGTISLTDGVLYLYGSGSPQVQVAPTLNNLSGGVINVASRSPSPIQGYNNGYSATPTLNNAGTVNWYLYGNTQTNGSYNFVNLNGGVTNLTQVVDVGNATTLDTTQTYSSNQTFGSAYYLSGGTLNATGDLTFANLYWSAGTIAGSGKLITPQGGSATLFGTGTKYLQNKTWDNAGTINLVDGTLYMTDNSSSVNLLPASVLNNASTGVINVTSRSGNPLYGYSYQSTAPATLNNAGVFNWDTTNSSQSYTDIQSIAFNNTGTLNVNQSMRLYNASGTDTGTIAIAADKYLELYAGTRTLGAGSSVTGAGTLAVNATLTVNGAQSLASAGKVALTGGTLNLDTSASSASISELAVSGGTLNTSDALTVNTLNWTSGTITSSKDANGVQGKLITPTAGVANLSGTGTKTLNDTLWDNSGTVNLSGGQLYLVSDNGSSAATTATPAVFNNLSGGTVNVNYGDTYTYDPIYGYSNGYSGASTFNNAGTLNWLSTSSYYGYTSIYNADFNNSGTVNVNETMRLYSSDGVDSGSYVVASGKTLEQYSGTRTMGAGSSVSGAGNLQVGSGVLNVTAALSVGSTGKVTVSGGTLNLNTSASSASIKELAVSSGTLNTSDALSVTTLNWSGGTISSSKDASNVQGKLITPSTGVATLSGTATKTLNDTVWDNSGTVNLSAGQLYLVADNGTSAATTATPAVFNNLAGGTVNVSYGDTYTYDPITGYSNGYSGAVTFNNAGTLNWLSSSSYYGYTSIYNTDFNNTGTVNVNETLRLYSSDGVDTGSYVVASGKTLEQYSGTRTMGAGSSVSGAGTLQVGSGVLNVTAALSVGSTGKVAVSGGTLNLNTSAPSASINELAVSSGTLNTSDALTVTTLNWSGGTITSSKDANNVQGKLITPTSGVAKLTGATDKTLNDTVWDNSGTVNLNGGQLYMVADNGTSTANTATPAVFNNLAGGTVNVDYGDTYTYNPIYGYSNGYSGTVTVNNAGTLNWQSTSSYYGYTSVYSADFNNSGTVNVNEILRLYNSNGSDTGSYVVASGKTLEQYGGTRTLGANSSVSGAGTLQVSSGVVNVAAALSVGSTGKVAVAGGTLNLNTSASSASINELAVSSGTLNTSDALTVNTLNWSGGTITSSKDATGAQGKLITPSASVTTLSGTTDKTLNDTVWDNSGTVTLAGGQLSLVADNGTSTVASTTPAVFNNLAGGTVNVDYGDTYTYNPVNGYSNGYSGTVSFNNAGTLNWSSTSSYYGYTSIYNADFTNSGTVNVNELLRLYGSNGTDSGSYVVASGKTLELNSGNRILGAASTVTGAGALAVSGGTLQVNGVLGSTGKLAVSGGTLTLSTSASNVTVSELAISGGTLNTSDELTANTFNWSGGTLTSSADAAGVQGKLITPTAGVANLSGAADKTLNDTVWDNSGTVNLSAGQLVLVADNGTSTATTSTAGVLNNLAGGTVNVTSTVSSNYLPFYGSRNIYSGTPTFNNTGTLNWNATASSYGYTGIYNMAFNNAGTANVGQTLWVNGGTLSQSGTLRLSNGAAFKHTTAYVNTGVIEGSGRLDLGTANLTNRGLLRPGGDGAVGTIAVTGNLLLDSVSRLDLEIAGATADTEYDRLTVSGSLTVGGQLEARLLNAYAPAAATNFDLLSAASASGSFVSSTLPPGFNGAIVASGGTTPNTYRLTASGLGCYGICWDGGAGTSNWLDAANWNTDALPGRSDLVFINLVSGTQVSLVSNSADVAGLYTAASNNLTLGTGATLSLVDPNVRSYIYGDLTLNGGSLVADGKSVNMAALSIANNASLSGSAALEVGSLAWGLGVISGSGTLTTTGSTTLTDAAILRNKVWSNTGAIAQTAGQLQLVSTASTTAAALNNSGSYTMTSTNATPLQGVVSNSGAVSFSNAAGAVLNWNAGDSGAPSRIADLTLNNAGQINVNGTLSGSQPNAAVADGLELYNTPGSSSGSIAIAAGKQLRISGSAADDGAQVLTTGSNITGSGTLKVQDGGDLTVEGALALASSGRVEVAGVSTRASLNLNSLTALPTFANLQVSGNALLSANANLTANDLSWAGGLLTGSGTLTTTGTTTLSGATTLKSKTWTNSGVVNQTDVAGTESVLTLQYVNANSASAVFNNAGTFNMQATSASPVQGAVFSDGTSNNSLAVWNNTSTGLVNWNAGYQDSVSTAPASPAISAISNLTLNNAGRINVNGTLTTAGLTDSSVADGLRLAAVRGSSSGSFLVRAGKTLALGDPDASTSDAASRTQTLVAGSSVLGTGTLQIETNAVLAVAGALDIAGSGKVRVQGGELSLASTATAPVFSNLEISDGTLRASSAVQTHNLVWSGGTVTGAGELTTTGTTQIQGAVTLQDKTWTNTGLVELSSNVETDGEIALLSTSAAKTATFNNAGTLTMSSTASAPLHGPATIPSNSVGAIVNNLGGGVINWNASQSGTAYTSDVYNLQFNNAGRVNVNGRTDPAIADGLKFYNTSGTDTLGASYVVAAGKTLQFELSPHTFSTPDSFSGAGAVKLTLSTSPSFLQSARMDVNQSTTLRYRAGPLQIGSVGGASHGAVAKQNDGSILYTPQTGYLGLDSFDVNVLDSANVSNILRVTVAVAGTVVRVVATSGQTKVYGNQDPTLAYTSTVETYNSTLLNPTLGGQLGRAAGESVGQYAIDQGSLICGPGCYVSFTPANFAITPRFVTLSGISVASKVYDGTNLATLTGQATLSGLYGTDAVSLNVGTNVTAAFADENVGYGKAVSITGLSLSGTAAGNYQINSGAATFADITPRTLTLTGLSANNKVYDGNTTATLAGSATLSGVLANDAVSFDSAALVAQFADKNVGTAKTVSLSNSALTGSDAGNYVLAASTPLTASITPLAISGSVTVNSKVYDRSTAATVATRTLAGVLSGDDVSYVGGSANFIDWNAGTAKSVSVTGLGLSGTGAGNYTVNSSASTTADISKATLTLTGFGIADKVYDGNTAATLSGTLGLTGVITNDVVSVNTANLSTSFADRNVGTGKTVSVTGLTLGGSDAANYQLSSTPSSATASITQRALSTWSGAAQNNLWSDAGNWDALPDGANVAAVTVPTGLGTVVYDASVNTASLSSLTVEGSSALSVSGGSLQVQGSLTTSNYVQSGGSVVSGAEFVVGNSYSQSGGTVSAITADITQASGNLVLGSVSAPTLSLRAPTGAISQSVALDTTTLTTVSALGTILNNSANRVSTWNASNTGSGNVELTSQGAVNIAGVDNAGGDITVVNFGGITTTQLIKASAGSVALTANSPLTVGSAGIQASGSITLVTTNQTSAGNMAINGNVVSSSGGLTLSAAANYTQTANLQAAQGVSVAAGGSVTVGTGASTTGNPVSYTAAGVSYNPFAPATPTTPTSTPVALALSTDTVVDFMDSFMAAVEEQAQPDEQLAYTDNPFDPSNKRAQDVVVEGEICVP